MKCAKTFPFVVEDALADLGERVSLARRARLLTQADLAAKAGIGVGTLAAVERGSASVQIGSVLMALWGLGLEGTFESLAEVGSDKELVALMADAIPRRVRSRRRKV